MNGALSGVMRLKRRKLAHSKYSAGKTVMRRRTPTAGVTSTQPSPLDSSRVVFTVSFKQLAQRGNYSGRRHSESAPSDEVAPNALADGVARLFQEALYLVRC